MNVFSNNSLFDERIHKFPFIFELELGNYSSRPNLSLLLSNKQQKRLNLMYMKVK